MFQEDLRRLFPVVGICRLVVANTCWVRMFQANLSRLFLEDLSRGVGMF